MRNSMRLLGRDARRCARPCAFCTSIAQRTASTTLRNSMMTAVAGALDDPAVVDGDRRIDEVTAKGPEPRQRAIFVCSSQPTVADYVGDQNRRDFPGLAHGAPLLEAPH